MDGRSGVPRQQGGRVVTADLEPHRRAVYGLCYRMLGSTVDAEDAVQETMLRAWKSQAHFEGRSATRTWLHRIATNVCIDRLRSGARRELPVPLGVRDDAPGTVDDELVTKPRTHWLEPVPDVRALPTDLAPDRVAELRQSLRLAFVAALQHLPPKQRAVLLLKDVIELSSEEIAETLETTTASVNSALQRARESLAAKRVLEREVSEPTERQRELVERYVDAFHRYDVDALVSLLRDDATLSMPPYTLWLEGPEAIGRWFLGRGIGCRGSRLVPASASGSVAFGQYRLGEDGAHFAWSLVVLDLDEDRIRSMTHFLDVETVFPQFDLPLRLPA
ncbi:MAG: sigma-70 family RNA polymerase sigma factor [Polyangiales bacterium]